MVTTLAQKDHRPRVHALTKRHQSPHEARSILARLELPVHNLHPENPRRHEIALLVHPKVATRAKLRLPARRIQLPDRANLPAQFDHHYIDPGLQRRTFRLGRRLRRQDLPFRLAFQPDKELQEAALERHHRSTFLPRLRAQPKD